VTETLERLPDRELAAKAVNSVQAARRQLDRITPYLCHKFFEVWRADLAEWRRYLADLPRVDSIESALQHLNLGTFFSYSQ
jgi:hypothetical protein